MTASSFGHSFLLLFLPLLHPSPPPLLSVVASPSTSRPPLCANRFVNARKLTNCTGRGFDRVPDRRSQVYGDTIALHLSRNNLVKLEALGFRFLPFLQHLDLSRNAIVAVASEAFSGLVHLDALDLSFNELVRVPSTAFAQLSFLTFLSLKGNPIRSLPASSFAATWRLSRLDLSDCGLVSVAPGVFASLSNLQELYLHGNQLKRMPDAALGKVPLTGRLRLLTLFHNPWHCDCRLRWLNSFVRRENVTFDGGVGASTACATPKRLQGRGWDEGGAASADERRFACAPELLATSPKVALTVDEGVAKNVTCRVTMDPVAPMIWFRNGRKLLRLKTTTTTTTTPKKSSSSSFAVFEWTDSSRNPPTLTSTLRVSAVTNATSGEFKCRAKNAAGFVETTTTIFVRRRFGGDDDIFADQRTIPEKMEILSSSLDYDDDDYDDVPDDDAKNDDVPDGGRKTLVNKRHHHRQRHANGGVILGGVVTGAVLIVFFLLAGAFIFCTTKTNALKLDCHNSSDSVVFRQYSTPDTPPKSAGNGGLSKKRYSFGYEDIVAGVFKRSERSALMSRRDDEDADDQGAAASFTAPFHDVEVDGDEFLQRPMAPVDPYPSASIHAALIRDLPRSAGVTEAAPDERMWAGGDEVESPVVDESVAAAVIMMMQQPVDERVEAFAPSSPQPPSGGVAFYVAETIVAEAAPPVAAAPFAVVEGDVEVYAVDDDIDDGRDAIPFDPEIGTEV